MRLEACSCGGRGGHRAFVFGFSSAPSEFQDKGPVQPAKAASCRLGQRQMKSLGQNHQRYPPPREVGPTQLRAAAASPALDCVVGGYIYILSQSAVCPYPAVHACAYTCVCCTLQLQNPYSWCVHSTLKSFSLVRNDLGGGGNQMKIKSLNCLAFSFLFRMLIYLRGLAGPRALSNL